MTTAPLVTPVKVKPVLTVFSATWCRPCRAAKPAIDQIETLGILTIIRYDINESPAIAKRYGVTSVPTFFFQGRRTHDVDAVLRWVKEYAKVCAEATVDSK